MRRPQSHRIDDVKNFNVCSQCEQTLKFLTPTHRSPISQSLIDGLLSCEGSTVYGLIAAFIIDAWPNMTKSEKPNSPEGESPSGVSSADKYVTGALRGEVWLTVQSHHAQRLILGRAAALHKPAIVGLVGFADRLRVIWNAARADDPYADWWLIKIDEALERIEAWLKKRSG